MKVGDTEPVQIGPHTVAQAEVREISDGQVVLVIPATRVVMGLKTELTDLPAAPAPATETIIDAAERSAAVGGDTPNVTDSTTSETVVETQENVVTSQSEPKATAEAPEATVPTATSEDASATPDAGSESGSTETPTEGTTE